MKNIVDESWINHVMKKLGGAQQIAKLINEQAERIAVFEEIGLAVARENLRLKGARLEPLDPERCAADA